MSEVNIMRRLQVCASNLGARLLRNNVGLGWIGKPQHIRVPTTLALQVGDLVLRKARPIKFGLGEGSSDLIGWQSVLITQDMVGKTIARFVAIEIKSEDGLPTPEQINFIAAIINAGGVSGLAYEEKDMETLLTPSK